MKPLLTVFISCTGFISLFGQAIVNVDFYLNQEDHKIHVEYDLIDENLNAKHNINLFFENESNEKIKPEKILGDISNVSQGRRKKIVWDALGENMNFSGNYLARVEIDKLIKIHFEREDVTWSDEDGTYKVGELEYLGIKNGLNTFKIKTDGRRVIGDPWQNKISEMYEENILSSLKKMKMKYDLNYDPYGNIDVISKNKFTIK